MYYDELTVDDLEDMDEDAWIEIAEDPEAPEEFLEWLIQEKAWEYADIQGNLAANPGMTDRLLGELLSTVDGDELIEDIINNPNFGDEALEEYIGEAEDIEDLRGIPYDVKILLIESGKLGEFYLHLLSQDKNYKVRAAVAGSDIDDTIVNNLLDLNDEDSDDYTESVLRKLVYNPQIASISKDLQKRLVTEVEYKQTILGLARNPKTPPYILYLIEQKYGDEVIDNLKDNPNYNPGFRHDQETLKDLNYSGDFESKQTRGIVNNNVNTDLELLQRLRSHVYLSTKKASIQKESTASNLLKALKRDGISVREPFYHSTNHNKGLSILKSGFKAKAGGPGNDAYYDNAVCFTRNFAYTQKGVFGRAEIIFILDKAELKQRYKIYPYNWFYTVKMSKDLPDDEQELFYAWIRGTQKEKLLSLYKELMGFDSDDEFISNTVKRNFEYLLKKFRNLGNKEKNSDFWEFEERVSTSNPLTGGIKETIISPKYIKAVLIYDMRAVDDIRSISNIPIIFYNAQKSGYYPIHEKNDLKRIPDEDLDEREIYTRYKNKFNSLNTIDYKRMIRLGIRPEDILESLKDSNISEEQLEKSEAYKYLKSMVDLFDRLSTESATKEDLQMALSSVNNPFEIIRSILKSGQTQFLLDKNVKSKVKSLTQKELRIISSDAIMSGRRFKTEQKVILSFLLDIKDIIPSDALDSIVYGLLVDYDNKELIKEFIGNKTNLNLGHVLYFIKKSFLSNDTQDKTYYKKLYDFLYSRADKESKEALDSL